jgi:hypothetical protein
LSCAAQTTIILVGDNYQLGPVCHCPKRVRQDGFCTRCHISQALHWQLATKHELLISERHASDYEFLEFLMLIRERLPTVEEIEYYLGKCMGTAVSMATISHTCAKQCSWLAGIH